MSIKRFDAYMNEFLSYYEENKHFVISGWIEAETVTHQDSCERIAQDFLAESSAGLTKYLDCAKLFFFHKDQMPMDWSRKLDFKIKKVNPSIKPPSLAFILMYQPSKAAEDVSLLPKIIPQLREPYIEPARSSQAVGRQKSFESELKTPEYTSDELTKKETENYSKNMLKNRNVSPITPQEQRIRARPMAEKHAYQPANNYDMDVEQPEEYEEMEAEGPREYLPVSRASESNTFRSQFSQQQGFKHQSEPYSQRGIANQPRNFQNIKSQPQFSQPQQQIRRSQQSQHLQSQHYHHQDLQQQQEEEYYHSQKRPQQQQYYPEEPLEMPQPANTFKRSLSKLEFNELPPYPKRQPVSSATKNQPYDSATKNFKTTPIYESATKGFKTTPIYESATKTLKPSPMQFGSNSKSYQSQFGSNSKAYQSQLGSNSKVYQSQQNPFYGSNRKTYGETGARASSQNVRDVLEEDNSGYYQQPAGYSQAKNFGKAPRGNFGQQQYANYEDEEEVDPRDLMNRPLRNLEEYPQSDNLYGSQRKMPQTTREEYFSQPAKISNTFRPNTQGYQPHKW